MRRNRAKARRRVLGAWGVWCGHPPGATLPSHLDPGVNRAHFRGSCAGAFGGAPRPSRWSDHLADHNRLPDRLRSRCWGAPWPAACWPMPPLPEEEMGIRTSGTQSSPPHTASCGSLLWLRMVEAERWSRTIAENPPPSRSDRNDRERPRDGPGNRQTTYHHPAEHPCDSSGGRAAPGHALALHFSGRAPCPNRRGSLAVTPTPAAASCLGPRSVRRPSPVTLPPALRGHALPAARNTLPPARPARSALPGAQPGALPCPRRRPALPRPALRSARAAAVRPVCIGVPAGLHPVLGPRPAPLCPALPCSAPSCPVLPRPALPCPALLVVARRNMRTPTHIAGVRVAL